MIYYIFGIFLSAFLLFQVEPMIAKYLLPWFGGTSAVWSTVVFFFQVLLTGGYAYAGWVLRCKNRREMVHLVLLGVSLLLMFVLGFIWKSPITPSSNWRPQGDNSPIGGIFKLLIISVGLPYFLLSSNSPLIQAWFNHAFPQKTVYRLYAISNIGSLLGLVTYPVLVEPNLSLAAQGRLWSCAYVLFAGLAAYGAIKSSRTKKEIQPSAETPEKITSPDIKDYFLWIGLATIPSILLLAVTSKITQEVAVIPFLWVLPLTIYLLTFVLAFSGERWYSRQLFLALFFVATLLTGWAMGRSDDIGFLQQIGIYVLLLFTACMVCHGELYRMRPYPTYLSTFYLMVSIGGTLGGLIINFVAPYVFKGYWELPIGLAICWSLLLIVTLVSKITYTKRWVFIVNEAVLFAAVIVTCVGSYKQIRTDLLNDLLIERNFYGVLRVRQTNFYAETPIHLGAQTIDAYHRYALIHGVIIHGYQFHDENLQYLPTSYYGMTSGVGLAILNHPKHGEGMRVGVLGLGVGTLVVYGQSGDVYRFYEINPAVIRLAEGENYYFSYLSNSLAKVEIIPGDARLSLEEELARGQPQNYDVLVLDVFSSDAIPVHLLDTEAFKVYLKQLSPEGILAIHITNRHLDFIPVIWPLADHFGLSRILIKDTGDGVITYPSEWILLARDPALLASPLLASHAQPMNGYISHLRLWTDDYNNFFQILK